MELLNDKQLDQIFYALSDRSRRQILSDLREGTYFVKDLARKFSFSKAATSKHLSVLEKANLIHKHRIGRDVRCSINPKTIQTVDQWVQFYTQFWNERLDTLEELLQSHTDE